ncbi:biotin transporter BioY [Tumebacillus permanentifrigoris]|uniref:Biotin transporter n=1 Tax=Tumebacillus permanentifrigoris TaxID=378543 RepID=A0A316DV57_9BACL|nr:biotin transporter BioY [Tumebacillus permanentifrigoris]PWK13072.1 biotin transport system substrate-specific component [Tumebacillus permanentifrigoris]
MNSKLTVRGLVFSALFAALIVVFSNVNIHLGFTPVPITLGNMVVMLAGVLLGAGYGFFSMLLVILLTLLGLPMLHGTGGLAVLAGPTGGYVMVYPICAMLVGMVASMIKGNGLISGLSLAVVVFVLGALPCYVGGVAWLMHVTGMTLEKALVAGCYPFLLGDGIKAIATALICLPIRHLYPVSRLVGTSTSKVANLR